MCKDGGGGLGFVFEEVKIKNLKRKIEMRDEKYSQYSSIPGQAQPQEPQKLDLQNTIEAQGLRHQHSLQKLKSTEFVHNFLCFSHKPEMLLVLFVSLSFAQCITSDPSSCSAREARLAAEFSDCVVCNITDLLSRIIPDDAARVNQDLSAAIEVEGNKREIGCFSRFGLRYREEYMRRACQDQIDVSLYRLFDAWGSVPVPTSLLVPLEYATLFRPTCWPAAPLCNYTWDLLNVDRRLIQLRRNTLRELAFIDRIQCDLNRNCLLQAGRKRAELLDFLPKLNVSYSRPARAFIQRIQGLNDSSVAFKNAILDIMAGPMVAQGGESVDAWIRNASLAESLLLNCGSNKTCQELGAEFMFESARGLLLRLSYNASLELYERKRVLGCVWMCSRPEFVFLQYYKALYNLEHRRDNVLHFFSLCPLFSLSFFFSSFLCGFSC